MNADEVLGIVKGEINEMYVFVRNYSINRVIKST